MNHQFNNVSQPRNLSLSQQNTACLTNIICLATIFFMKLYSISIMCKRNDAVLKLYNKVYNIHLKYHLPFIQLLKSIRSYRKCRHSKSYKPRYITTLVTRPTSRRNLHHVTLLKKLCRHGIVNCVWRLPLKRQRSGLTLQYLSL